MNVRSWIHIAVPATALLIAGCGGGGGGGGASSVPSSPGSGSGGTGISGTQRAGQMVISIPAPGTSSTRRHTAGISSGAVSVSIAVTGVPAAQTFDVSPSSTSCAPASGGGRTCTLSVQAGVGPDTFTVSVYDAAGGTGNLLGSGSATTTVIPGVPFSVNVTLQSIIASLALAFPTNSGGGGGPPVGVPGSTIAYVAAKDASGAFIVGAFSTPVNITSSDPSITCSPCTVSGTGAPVTFTYDGTQKNPITITASSGSITGTFPVLPRTNIVSYQEPLAGGFQIRQGPDGAIYVGEIGPTTLNPFGGIVATGPGKISRLDPVAKTFSSVTVGQIPIGFTWTPDGVLWVANSGDGTIGRLTSFSSGSFTAFPVPNPAPTSPASGPRPRDIVVGADGNLWFANAQGTCPCAPTRVARVGTFTEASPAAMTMFAPAAGARFQSIHVGADNKFYLADPPNNAVEKVDTTGALVGTYPLPAPSPFPRFMATGSDGNVYVAALGPLQAGAQPAGTLVPGAIYQLTPGGVTTAFPLLSPQSGAESLSPGPAGLLYFSDLNIGALGSVTTSGAVTEWPIVQGCATATTSADAAGITPSQVMYVSDGTLWYTEGNCVQNPAATHLSHMILASGWQLYPVNSTIYLSPVTGGASGAQTQLLGIAESGDSSPFSVVSSNPSIVSVSPTSSTHDFLLTATGTGSVTIVVTDKNNRSTTKNVSVTGATGTIQTVLRREP